MDLQSDACRTPLNRQRVETELAAQGWNHVEIVQTTGSTNSDLRERAASLPERSVLVAEEQTSGRGRLGRAWVAPLNTQVTVSVLLRPQVGVGKLGLLPLLTGLALAEAVAKWSVDVSVKWPNDLLVNGKKLCGILAEAVDVESSPPCVVIGFGLNVGLRQSELPIEQATSLMLEGCYESRTEVLIALVGSLLSWLKKWEAAGGDFSSFADDYQKFSSTLGSRVRAELPGGRDCVGVAIDISDSGELLIRDERGVVTTISAGDVTHLRRA